MGRVRLAVVLMEVRNWLSTDKTMFPSPEYLRSLSSAKFPFLQQWKILGIENGGAQWLQADFHLEGYTAQAKVHLSSIQVGHH